MGDEHAGLGLDHVPGMDETLPVDNVVPRYTELYGEEQYPPMNRPAIAGPSVIAPLTGEMVRHGRWIDYSDGGGSSVWLSCRSTFLALVPPMDNRQVVIESLPEDKLSVDNFALRTVPVPEPGQGEVLCRTLVLTVGAGQRAALQGSAGYAGAPKAGVVMGGTGVCRVERSNAAEVATGSLVVCQSGWQEYSVHPASALRTVNSNGDPADHVGVYGANGLTAYFGLFEIGEPQPGQTVVVSAAAGSVGHLAGQMATIAGCRTVGVAGSDEKCRLLTEKLGFDAAVNYRSPDYRQAFRAACEDGIDVYFDNTGGEVLGSALRRMNRGGRIVCCGVVSQYDTSNPAPGPRGVPGLLINRRVRMEGFLVFDYAERYGEAIDRMRGWMNAGRLNPLNDEFHGLGEAPRAFVDLLAGGNVGTRIVRIAV